MTYFIKLFLKYLNVKFLSSIVVSYSRFCLQYFWWLFVRYFENSYFFTDWQFHIFRSFLCLQWISLALISNLPPNKYSITSDSVAYLQPFISNPFDSRIPPFFLRVKPFFPCFQSNRTILGFYVFPVVF